ncbi:hypothetical protein MKW92_003432, partial [Papaver armeniacum]
HENTMHRNGEDHWPFGYATIARNKMIWINGERLDAIFPPGHNGGHMDWFHFTTNSLFVEYPCFGQGSA